MDPARIGQCRIGSFHIGVYRDDWQRLLNRFKKVAGCEVTRRALGLGYRSTATGWRAKNWGESTIEGLLIPRSATSIAVSAGVYVRLDASFLTADPMQEGDEIKTGTNVFYEAKGVKPHYIGDNFYFRECELTRLPFHE